MSSFRPSSQSLKTIRVVSAKLLLLFAVIFCVVEDFRVSGVGSDQWIRLCTFTNNGSSQMNVTMPCGVQVKNNGPEDDYKENTGVSESWPEVNDSVEYVKITLAGGHNTITPEKHPRNSTNRENSYWATRQDNDLTTKDLNYKTSKGDAEGEVDAKEEVDAEEEVEAEEEVDAEKEGVVDEEEEVEEEGEVEEERDERKEEGKEKDAGTDAEDGNDDHDVEIDIGDDDEGQSMYDEDVTILNVEANEEASKEREQISGMKDQLKNRRRGTAVTKVMLGYLSDARNQFYDKIHYLLNLLEQTFFKFNYRHRRNSIERRSLFNNMRIQGNKRKPSFSSMILEPTFERSMMTMSFLMFGLFVIQVVQKLMQTIHQPGENSFIGSSIFGNLPSASSNIF